MERNIRGKTCTLGPGGDDGADGHQGAPRAKRARTAAPAPHAAAEDEEGVRRKAKRAAAAAPAAAASGSSLRAVEVSDDDLAVLGVQRIPGGSSGGAGGGYQDDDDHDVDGEESENERSLNASPGVAEAIRSSAGKTLKLTGSGGANGKARKQKRQVSGGGGGGDDLLRFRRPRAVLAELQGCKASTCSGDSAANANDDSSPAGKNPFDGVSDEILLHVFRWLSRHVLSRAAQSCRRFRRIAEDELFWRKMDLGSKCVVPSGVVGLVAARGAQVIRAPRVSLASPVMRGLLPLTSSAEAAAKGFKLSVVDLSGAAIQPKDLEELLCSCNSLRKISLENLELTDRSLSEGLACNPRLEVLHLGMARGVTCTGLRKVLESCRSTLKELNVAWTDLSLDTVTDLTLAGLLPPGLERLNLSGCRETLEDAHIIGLTRQCNRLLELDVSDAVQLTDNSLKSICDNLFRVESLSTSRCYSINPLAYLDLETDCPSLQYLNLFGVLKDHSLKALRNHLAPRVTLNKHLFSSIARPTVGIRRTSVWGIKVTYSATE